MLSRNLSTTLSEDLLNYYALILVLCTVLFEVFHCALLIVLCTVLYLVLHCALPIIVLCSLKCNIVWLLLHLVLLLVCALLVYLTVACSSSALQGYSLVILTLKFSPRPCQPKETYGR